MTAPALAVTDLRKSYGQHRALDGLSLTAPAGAVTALLGPNGAGKTTTVEICEGLRQADAGEVRVLGQRPGARALRARVGVMPQRPGAYPGARAGEMLALLAAYYREPLDPAALLDRLGLTSVAGRPWRRLSGGQQQRLSLAMALVGRPDLVFLDEPSAGLDVQAREEVWKIVTELRADQVSVLLTTHDLTEAAELADQVVIVDHGRAVAAGSVPELTGGELSGSLRFRARSGLALAALTAALPAGLQAQEQPAGHYQVLGEITPAVLAAVTAWAATQDALATDLQVARHSLREVFLELTGRELRA